MAFHVYCMFYNWLFFVCLQPSVQVTVLHILQDRLQDLFLPTVHQDRSTGSVAIELVSSHIYTLALHVAYLVGSGSAHFIGP